VLNYNHLYYFHVAATEGSLAAAATKLGVKQPTVSEQLRTLERSLGKQLFERSSTGMRLTTAGQIAFEHTSTMFRTADKLLQALGSGGMVTPRALRVGLSMAVARATSADFLLPLFALDECLPTIRTGDSLELLRDLRGNELDLVICESEPSSEVKDGLVHVTIDQVPLVAIVSVETELDAQWEKVGLIQYRPTSRYRWEVEEFLDSRNVRPRIVGEADDPQLLVEAAARGEFIAIVPRLVARDALAAGRVRVVAQLDSGHGGIHALYQDTGSAELSQRAIELLIERHKSAD
jgi:LysR family transcriptional regulator, transcriptional activator of nhaA